MTTPMTLVELRDAIAKAVADVIGHGMREKCERHADAVIAVVAPQLRATAEHAALAQPAQVAGVDAACEYCDGTGDVHGIDGEWRGECTACRTAEPVAQGEVVELLAYLDDQAQHPRDQFGNGSNKPNPALKAWYAKQAAVVRALAAQPHASPEQPAGRQGEVCDAALTAYRKTWDATGTPWPGMTADGYLAHQRAVKAVAALTNPAAPVGVPSVCDGKEQDAFEAWASGQGYNMARHSLHWLFLNEHTYAARQGWKGALKYVTQQLAAAPSAPQAND